MIYVEAPDTIGQSSYPSLFLAGGISGTLDWQINLIELIKSLDLIVFNPRRKNFPMGDPTAAEAQITWEFEHLKKASMVSFWFPKETMCPITLLELGKQMMINKPLIVGVDPLYQRKQDVEIQLKLARPEVAVVYSIENLSDQITSALRNWNV